jgi:hypothetical protein
VGLALAPRLVGLDRKSVWFERALGLEAAYLPLGGLLTTVGAERNPPLYFLLQHFWLPLHAAAAFIESQWQPGDLIVHTSEFSAVPFDYYLRGRLEQVLVGAEDDVALREAAAEQGRLWLVRDFGLMDPAEAEQAASALPGLPVGRRFDWLGVGRLAPSGRGLSCVA